MIEFHNSYNGADYQLGHNRMSTWTEEEYKRLLGFRPYPSQENESEPESIELEFEAPKSVDWRKEGAVTPVKD